MTGQAQVAVAPAHGELFGGGAGAAAGELWQLIAGRGQREVGAGFVTGHAAYLTIDQPDPRWQGVAGLVVLRASRRRQVVDHADRMVERLRSADRHRAAGSAHRDMRGARTVMALEAGLRAGIEAGLACVGLRLGAEHEIPEAVTETVGRGR